MLEENEEQLEKIQVEAGKAEDTVAITCVWKDGKERTLF